MIVSNHPVQVVPHFELRVLGNCELDADGEPLDITLWPRKASTLLRILAVMRDRRLSREEAIELLWPESSPWAGTSSLKNLLFRLRRHMESENLPPVVVLEHGWVTLNPAFEWLIDAEVIRDMFVRPDADLGMLERAAHLLRGDPLLEDRYEDWANPVREGLLHAWRGICVRLIAMERDRGAHTRELAWAERLAAVDPMHEEAVQLRLRALISLGRRGEAIRVFRRFETQIQAELGVPPAEETSLLIAAPTNVSAAVAPIVGRDSEVKDLETLLNNRYVRLVTLVGAGGVGKTRLAMEVARRVGAHFPDGVFFVSLGALVKADLVLHEAAQVLGLDDDGSQQPLDRRLADWIGRKRICLIFDNFEHVLEASTSLARLLDRCPGLATLATSRTPLHLTGEYLFDVSSLALPAVNVAEDALRKYGAVELFMQRAFMARSNSAVSATYVRAAAEICRRLDGLPLAIELAAARTRVVSPETLLRHLSARLPLLTTGRVDAPPRQRTLKATIDWSYDLLDVNEQQFFRRLGVFVGGFTLEAAGKVCQHIAMDDGAVLELVASLVEKSVLCRVGNDENRYAMLETIAEYARDRLHGSDEFHRVQEAHASFYLLKAEDWETQYDSANIEWLERYDCEMANIRAALAWCLTYKKPEVGLRLVAAAAPYWYRRVRWEEGKQWIEAMLLVGQSTKSIARARALRTLGLMAAFTGDLERAETASYAAIEIFKGSEQLDGIAWSLHNLALVASRRGDLARAMRLNCEIRDRFRALGIEPGAGIALLDLAEAARLAGDYPRSIRWATECIASFRAMHMSGFLAQGLVTAAASLVACGQFDQASDYIQEGLTVAQSLNDKWVTIRALNVGVLIAEGRGDELDAARFADEAEELRSREIGAQSDVTCARCVDAPRVHDVE